METPPKRMAAIGASLGESVYPLAKKWLISALEQPPKSLTLLELMLPNGKNTEKTVENGKKMVFVYCAGAADIV